MTNLSNQDLHALLAVIEILHSESNPTTLITRTVSAVKRIISGKFIAFDGFDSDDKFAHAEWYTDYALEKMKL